MRKIYIIEDDANIRELVIYALFAANFNAVGFETGGDFFDALKKSPPPDLILLDIMLPEDDGYSILKKMKNMSAYKNIPVIMLTSKGAEYDKVKGLDAGADDYVAKPFGVTELISRINAVLRRSVKEDADRLVFNDIVLDNKKRSVTAGGDKIALTFKEYELLQYLIINAELVLSRDKITDAVWGYGFEGGTRTVDMHVKTLRQKLGAAGSYIKTIRNVGYKIGE